MSDDDLRINTLHRFAKHSPRLTLQEYSHCEVPAGCGGVVFRWIDPQAGPVASIRGLSLGTADTWLDGVALTSDRAPIGPGRHVLAFHFEGLDRAIVPVALSLAGDLGPDRAAVNRLEEATSHIERWSPGPQSEAVVAVDFDDRAWQTTRVARASTLAALPDRERLLFERCQTNGMTVIELEAAAPIHDAWLRIDFVIDPAVLRA